MRQTTVLDKNWIFYKNPDSGEGENVTLPHTWNAVDGQDGGNDYYRGTCNMPAHLKNQRWNKTERLIWSLTEQP